MGWTETRGSTAAAAIRRTAHSDDAKHRVDDASHSLSPRFPKWVPLVVAGALVVLVGTGATAAFVGARDNDPRPSSTPAAPGDESDGPTGEGPTSDGPTVDQGPAVHETTGLPLAPTTEEVTYRATVTCVKKSRFYLSPCGTGPGLTSMLTCPDGTCTLAMWITPLTGARSGAGYGSRAAYFTFQAGQPSVSMRGQVPSGSDKCAPQPVTVTGNRGADGAYSLRFVMDYHAGNGDGSCSSSPGTWSVELQATA